MSETAEAAAPTHPLRRYREKHALRGQDIADQAGVSKATISRIESGEIEPPFELIRKLVSVCNSERGALCVADFVEWRGSAPPDAIRRRFQSTYYLVRQDRGKWSYMIGNTHSVALYPNITEANAAARDTLAKRLEDRP